MLIEQLKTKPYYKRANSSGQGENRGAKRGGGRSFFLGTDVVGWARQRVACIRANLRLDRFPFECNSGRTMKTHLIIALFFAASSAFVSCTPTQRGAATGAAAGAGIGALASRDGRRGRGALIGGAVGGAAGAAVGAGQERRQRQFYGPGF